MKANGGSNNRVESIPCYGPIVFEKCNFSCLLSATGHLAVLAFLYRINVIMFALRWKTSASDFHNNGLAMINGHVVLSLRGIDANG